MSCLRSLRRRVALSNPNNILNCRECVISTTITFKLSYRLALTRQCCSSRLATAFHADQAAQTSSCMNLCGSWSNFSPIVSV